MAGVQITQERLSAAIAGDFRGRLAQAQSCQACHDSLPLVIVTTPAVLAVAPDGRKTVPTGVDWRSRPQWRRQPLLRNLHPAVPAGSP